jgi:RNA recognition motif-containing protein
MEPETRSLGRQTVSAAGYIATCLTIWTEALGSILRGPPRKPKQSGHALWVGNLPTNTSVVELKDHFSMDATKDIASVFLISKSNCAFVNYRTEEACDAAVQRFNESLFKGLRLVCRQRKASNAGIGAPSGPSQRDSSRPERRGSTVDDDQDQPDEDATETVAPRPRSKDRFVIVKSLTVQDLEQSVRNGIWATQTHNEASLNEAYEVSGRVWWPV